MRLIIKIISCLLLLGMFMTMILFGQLYINKEVKNKKMSYNSRMIPTIMIPGSSATQERFDSMIKTLNTMGKTHSILKLTVSESGNISYSGQLSTNDTKPYIIIAFSNNTDGYANIKKQTQSLDIAMQALQNRYHFKQFNAVGHSNGGLNWTIYLEKYYNSQDFNIQTLVTLGSPYNFEETNSSNRTQLLQDLISNNTTIPQSLLVYNIAGSQSYDDDYIVPLSSVESGKYVFQKIVKQYTQLTVTGDDAEHSDLPQNKEVIQLIVEKILQGNQKPRKKF